MAQTAQKSQPKLVTIPDAAVQLGYSREQIYDLMQAGELAYVQPKARSGNPGNRRIEQAEIDAFIARNRVTP